MKLEFHNIYLYIVLLCVLLLLQYWYLSYCKYKNYNSDYIVNKDVYIDLVEEYFYFNRNITDEKNVFVGDSITKRFNIYEFSYEIKVVNRGIFSDTTFGLLNRLDANVNNLKVGKLFIMIGFNDLKIRSNEEIIANIKQILLKAKAKKKYIQSLLPVNSDRKELNDRISSINDQLRKIASEEGYIYVDLHSHFKDSKNGIKPELTSDGIHPNYHGFQLWFYLIEPLL